MKKILAIAVAALTLISATGCRMEVNVDDLSSIPLEIEINSTTSTTDEKDDVSEVVSDTDDKTETTNKTDKTETTSKTDKTETTDKTDKTESTNKNDKVQTTDKVVTDNKNEANDKKEENTPAPKPQPKPEPAPVVNEFINNNNNAIDANSVSIKPKHVYWDGNTLVAECFVINGFGHNVFNINVKSYALANSKGVIASGSFGTLQNVTLAPNTHVVWTFRFSADCISQQGADLSSLMWQANVSNNY